MMSSTLSSSSSPAIRPPHLVVLFLLGQHNSPSSASKPRGCSAFSPSGSLSPDEPWSFIFFVYAVGPLECTVHSHVPLLSTLVAMSGFALTLAFALAFSFASSASLVTLSPYQSGLLPLEPVLLLSSCFHDATPLIWSAFSYLSHCWLCTLSKRSHTRRRMTRRCSCPNHSVSFSHRAYRHFPCPLALVRRLRRTLSGPSESTG